MLLVVRFENVRPAALLERNFRATFGLIAEIARRRYIRTRPRDPQIYPWPRLLRTRKCETSPPIRPVSRTDRPAQFGA